MDNNLENNDWKQEAPNLAAMPVHQSFSVPEGYFEQLPHEIVNGIYLEKIKAKAIDSGFNTPENYFNELNQQINSEILAERLKNIVPFAEQAAVPPNYFEHLQANILAKTVDQDKKQSSKIVRLLHSSMLKYASAACFILLSATGLYFYQQQSHTGKLVSTDIPTDQMLYDIDEQIIIDHIEANDLHQSKLAASDLVLENYILNNYSQSDIASNY